MADPGKRGAETKQSVHVEQRSTKLKRSRAAPCEILNCRDDMEAGTTSTVPSVVRGDASTAAVAIENALSREEAVALVEWARKQGFAFGWGSDDAHAVGRKDYRSAYTVEMDDAALTAQLWLRLRHALPNIVRVTSSECDDPSSVGNWRPVGLHPRLLFVEYKTSGHFSPHSDGFLVTSLHERSLFTALVYLNDVDVGGKELIRVSILPLSKAPTMIHQTK